MAKLNEWASYKVKHPYIYFIIFIFSCLGLFVINTVQGVFFKRMADDFPTAPYFVLVFCSASFVIVFFVMMVIRYILNLLYCKLRSVDFPKYNYVGHGWLMLIGLLDSLNGLILLFAAHKTPASLHPILPNITIPFTFVMSYILIRQKFRLKHFFGDMVSSFIVLVGVLISIIPVFIDIAHNPDSVKTSAIWPIIFILGILPGALMNIVQERASKDVEKLDYIHLNGWVSVYQLVCDFLFFWANFVFPTNIHNLGDLGSAFDKGFQCLGGINVITNGTVIGNCHMAAIDTSVFVSGHVGTHLFSALLLRMSSSIFISLVNVFVSPMAEFIFFIVGMDKITWYVGAALPIMMIGIIFNTIVDYFKAKSDSQDEKRKEVEENEDEYPNYSPTINSSNSSNLTEADNLIDNIFYPTNL